MTIMKTFKDSLNTAVFITTFVFKDKKPITHVLHEIEDGAWQFFSDDDYDDFEKVAMVVSLDEIIEFDKTVLEIADLPLGYYATRKSIAENWAIHMNLQ
jgi:hypothetical protein